MFIQMLESKTFTRILLLALGCLAVLAYLSSRRAPEVAAYPTASVMYLIPDNVTEVEQKLAPELFMEASTLPFSATTEWRVISDLAAQGTLEALVIHHAALDKVDWELIRPLFNRQGLVVAGIGIPGDQLAELVGRPELFTSTWPAWRDGYTYTTSAYFYIYSYWIEGAPTDVAKVEGSGTMEGPINGIENPLSRQIKASTDSLVPEGGIATFVHLIELHIEAIQESKSGTTIE